jgi:hypothetical protein
MEILFLKQIKLKQYQGICFVPSGFDGEFLHQSRNLCARLVHMPGSSWETGQVATLVTME